MCYQVCCDLVLIVGQCHPGGDLGHSLVGPVAAGHIAVVCQWRVFADAIPARLVVGLVGQADHVAIDLVRVVCISCQTAVLDGVLVCTLRVATIASVVMDIALYHLLNAEGDGAPHGGLVSEVPDALDVGDRALGPAASAGGLVLHHCYGAAGPPVKGLRRLRGRGGGVQRLTSPQPLLGIHVTGQVRAAEVYGVQVTEACVPVLRAAVLRAAEVFQHLGVRDEGGPGALPRGLRRVVLAVLMHPLVEAVRWGTRPKHRGCYRNQPSNARHHPTLIGNSWSLAAFT
mmetsp:Transcript_71171/g.189247  ORF Transcript_71171/g.189247 Transcript_71171/m.189247 type:complete len:286 (-) Transcript_71171:3-860(-)